jgi:hypothetical protein
MAGMGPPPKPASKRRRRTPPASYGAAHPTVGPAAAAGPHDLGFNSPHPLVARLWVTLQTSAEARFYSPADWQRASLELLHVNELLTSGKPIPAASWAQVQHGMNALLISPAEKRRCGIELKPPIDDPDENASVLQMVTYQSVLNAE